MNKAIQSLMHQATKTPEKLNIITTCYDEKMENDLSKTGHNLFCMTVPMLTNKWNKELVVRPPNHTIIEANLGITLDNLGFLLPQHINYDAVVIYERSSQYELGRKLAACLCIPLICITNNVPISISSEFDILGYADMVGNRNVFTSKGIKDFWKMDGNVVKLGVDVNKFKPTENKKPKIITVENSFRERSRESGFANWRRIVEGYNYEVFGTNNLGLNSKTLNYTVAQTAYQDAMIYLNTSVGGVFPISILEAMSCGCCPITMKYPGIEEYIEHGTNGFICDSVEACKKSISKLIFSDKLRNDMSKMARKTIEDNFGLDKFIDGINTELFGAIKDYKENPYDN